MTDIASRVENLNKQYPSTPLRTGRIGGPQAGALLGTGSRSVPELTGRRSSGKAAP